LSNEYLFKRVKIKTKTGLEIEGTVLPRYALFSNEYLTIKLDNGYNIGIKKDNIVHIEEVERPPKREVVIYKLDEEAATKSSKTTKIILTGGTIASKIDYETGGVTPILTASELLEAIPELREITDIELESPMSIFSEEMTPHEWKRIAEIVAKELLSNPDRGLIIAHGTDTMGYTSAALSFALQNLPSPVALVGAQRSSDRPSSDSAFNLLAAALYATSNIGEVSVVMHGTISDTYALAHRGTRVRKMHTSRRDAFQSINSLPIAKILPYEKKIVLLRKDIKETKQEGFEAKTNFSDKVALIKFYPGMSGDVIDFLVDKGYRGIVIEGTGLGHVSLRLLNSIKRAVEQEAIVTMTSQCIFGTINMNVYSTGRKLLEAGVLPSADMLPETAFVKLSWLLGNYNDIDVVKKLYVTNLVGEIEYRRTISAFPRWYHGE
jgi:glutamyl-tRNA(Gln) amidotransferase subunit D